MSQAGLGCKHEGQIYCPFSTSAAPQPAEKETNDLVNHLLFLITQLVRSDAASIYEHLPHVGVGVLNLYGACVDSVTISHSVRFIVTVKATEPSVDGP